MAKHSGESELVYCNHCHSYKEFQYCEDEVVSEIPCKCKPDKIDKKLLDKFIEQYNKSQGVKNEKSSISSN
jgi:hypothetical protein